MTPATTPAQDRDMVAALISSAKTDMPVAHVIAAVEAWNRIAQRDLAATSPPAPGPSDEHA